MTAQVTVGNLRSCEVSSNGEEIRINVADQAGAPHQICLSPDMASALAMTLPRLLSAALQARYADPSIRFVFPLGGYTLEQAPGDRQLLLSLKTPDGFEVCFRISQETIRSLAVMADGAQPSFAH
ncbi:hypothetical protein [Aestuariivirga sp.]|uniref:hypothetical protein n=1 Tax=Aestuariivirga sp. TaxID=2650926 RepID=UPI0039E23F8E